MNYYERHLGDYARNAGHLSMLEHGAYTLLLDRYYVTEQPIPADQTYRVARAKTRDERAAVDAVLAEFFTLVDGAYVNTRTEEEIEKARRKIETSRNNGRGGGRPKKNPPETRQDTHQKPGGFSLGSENGTQSKALQTPDTKHQTPEEGSLRSPSGVRVEIVSRETLSPEFESFMLATYPEGKPDADFGKAIHFAMGLVGSGRLTEETLRRRVTGYRAYVDSQGVSGQQYVIKPQNWFNPSNPDKHWDKDWRAMPTKAQAAQDANIAASQAWLNRTANA